MFVCIARNGPLQFIKTSTTVVSNQGYRRLSSLTNALDYSLYIDVSLSSVAFLVSNNLRILQHLLVTWLLTGVHHCHNHQMTSRTNLIVFLHFFDEGLTKPSLTYIDCCVGTV